MPGKRSIVLESILLAALLCPHGCFWQDGQQSRQKAPADNISPAEKCNGLTDCCSGAATADSFGSGTCKPDTGILGRPDQAVKMPGIPLVIGHRGLAWNDDDNPFPENTIMSVEAALKVGAQAVEIDVLKTLDGVIVLYHEAKLDYNNTGIPKTDCTGSVVDKTWEEIRDCNVNSYATDGFTSPLDRLEWLMEVPGLGLIILDVKNDFLKHESLLTIDRIMAILEEYDSAHRVVLMLYEPETIQYASGWDLRSCLKKHHSGGLSPVEIADLVEAAGGWCLFANDDLLTEPLLFELQSRALQAMTYFLGQNISDKVFYNRLDQYAEWEVYGFITDRVADAVLYF
jgi:glycerophosphoryl diester phosphodiesterase